MKITPKIYKIDPLKVGFIHSEFSYPGAFSNALIPEVISSYHDRKRQDGIETGIHFVRQSNVNNEVRYSGLDHWNQIIHKNFSLAVYTASNQEQLHPFANFFPGAPIADLIGKSIPNAAIFFFDQDKCYAFSIGRWYLFFEAFVDLEFPLDVARRIMDPNVSHTHERDITGAVFWRIQQFRTNQLIESQSIGTVWNLIDGDVIDSVRESDEFKDIFKPIRKKVGMAISSCLELRSSVDYESMVRALLWIESLLRNPLEPGQWKYFEQLDGIKEISIKKHSSLVKSLELELIEKIKNSITTGNPIDLDFSHPNYLAYRKASLFRFVWKWVNAIQFEDRPPTATEVIKALSDNWILNFVTLTAEEILAEFKRYTFSSINPGYPNDTLNSNLLNYLHGEVYFDNKSYFRIDGRWYHLNLKFSTQLKNDFAELIGGDFFQTAWIPALQTWTGSVRDEGEFNELHATPNSIIGDRALLHNNIELADIIFFPSGDGRIYFFHNKIGFWASTRDVCSQVLQSMTWLERIRKWGDKKELEDYYEKIKGKHYRSRSMPLTKAKFVKKLMDAKSKSIVYVIWYASANKVSANSKSNIAKFESLKLCKFDIRHFDFGLKFLHIPKATTPTP